MHRSKWRKLNYKTQWIFEDVPFARLDWLVMNCESLCNVLLIFCCFSDSSSGSSSSSSSSSGSDSDSDSDADNTTTKSPPKLFHNLQPSPAPANRFNEEEKKDPWSLEKLMSKPAVTSTAAPSASAAPSQSKTSTTSTGSTQKVSVWQSKSWNVNNTTCFDCKCRLIILAKLLDWDEWFQILILIVDFLVVGQDLLYFRCNFNWTK